MKTKIISYLVILVCSIASHGQDFYNAKYTYSTTSGWAKLATLDLTNQNYNSVMLDVKVNYVRTIEEGYSAVAKLFLRKANSTEYDGKWSYSISGTKVGDYLKFKKISSHVYELFGYSPGWHGHLSTDFSITKEKSLLLNIPTTITLVANPDIYTDAQLEGTSSFFGDIGIGTTTLDGYQLAVKGKIRAEEIKVDTGWADYVFEEGYDLPTLEEVEQHIKEKGHLINIPSAKEVAENGVQLGEINKLLLEKIEELTLYILIQDKQIQKLQRLEGKQLILEKQIKALQHKTSASKF